jgi:uncharacterized protein YfaS (alpha-2-macroglobulin family)
VFKLQFLCFSIQTTERTSYSEYSGNTRNYWQPNRGPGGYPGGPGGGPGGPAGPGGPGGPGGSGGPAPAPISVRKEFPETWIWEDIMNDNCNPVKLTKKVPDTITSWLISAFSLNQDNGLGLNEKPTSLTVFRPFFISTTLPYSVRRGEELTLSIQVFNYLSDDQDVSVTMSNDAEQFEFKDDTDADHGEFNKI